MSDTQAVPQAADDTPPSALRICRHVPACPPAEAVDREAAHVVAAHPEQGWSLLCNGVVVFEDFGEILPDGHCNGSRHRELALTVPHRRAS